jgi:hypothetical protein
VPGSFDLTRFQVLSDYAYLRVTLRTLVPTFGVIDGAHLLDVYVITPPGVSQDTELDPTQDPVAIQPVVVP